MGFSKEKGSGFAGLLFALKKVYITLLGGASKVQRVQNGIKI